MIHPLTTQNLTQQKAYTQTSTLKNRKNISFTAMPIAKSDALQEKGMHSLEMLFRKTANKVTSWFNSKQTNALYNEIANVDTKSSEYIPKISKLGRFFAKGKEVEINLESGMIEKLAQSDDACIFIMNHDNQSRDPQMLTIFNTLLNEEYMALGKTDSCPRPKIILNEDILTSMNKKMRTVFEKLGAVGVDANIFNKKDNAKKLFPAMRAFAEDKANIFIFPEGKLARHKDVPLEKKFQAGVAGMVYSILQRKPQVKVVPLGFAYNTKAKPELSSIHIGIPVLFKKDGDKILVSRGNIDSNFADKDYVNFFNKNKDNEFSTITSGGKPVLKKANTGYISGILCENLKICKKEAKNVLPKNSLGDNVLDY